MGSSGEADDVDVVLQALAHPLRRRIIEVLGREGAQSYAELMRKCGVDDSGTFAFHLRRLRGLVEKRGENGEYALTGLGRRAYDVLLFLRGEKVGRDVGEKSERIVFSDRVSFVLTREHVERARRLGRRIIVRDIYELVIEPIPSEVFDEVVEEVRDVALVYAPVELRAVLDEKLRDVYKVKYYSGDRPQKSLFSGLLTSLSLFLSSLERRHGVRVSREYVVDPAGDVLVLRVEACSARLLVGDVERVVMRVSGVNEPVSGLREQGGAVYAWCVGGKNARAEIVMPKGWPRKLSVSVSAGDLAVEKIVVRVLELKADSADARLVLGFSGDNPSVLVRSEASAVRLNLDFTEGWHGVARIGIESEASSVNARLIVPHDVPVSVEPSYDATAVYRLVVGGKRVSLPYRDSGFDDAVKKVAIGMHASSSALEVVVEKG